MPALASPSDFLFRGRPCTPSFPFSFLTLALFFPFARPPFSSTPWPSILPCFVLTTTHDSNTIHISRTALLDHTRPRSRSVPDPLSLIRLTQSASPDRDIVHIRRRHRLPTLPAQSHVAGKRRPPPGAPLPRSSPTLSIRCFRPAAAASTAPTTAPVRLEHADSASAPATAQPFSPFSKSARPPPRLCPRPDTNPLPRPAF